MTPHPEVYGQLKIGWVIKKKIEEDEACGVGRSGARVWIVKHGLNLQKSPQNQAEQGGTHL